MIFKCPKPLYMFRTETGYKMKFDDNSETILTVATDRGTTLPVYNAYALLITKRMFQNNTSSARHLMEKCLDDAKVIKVD